MSQADFFNSYGSQAAPARPAPRAKIDPRSGGILVKTGLDKKLDEGRRLTAQYRRLRRQENQRILACEPRLLGLLRYVKTVGFDDGAELLDALSVCDWLLDAEHSVRILALQMIAARCDRLNRRLGNFKCDDPIPPELGGPPDPIFFRARAILQSRARL